MEYLSGQANNLAHCFGASNATQAIFNRAEGMSGSLLLSYSVIRGGELETA